MDARALRLQLLHLTCPKDLASPDMAKWIERAKKLEEYVLEASDTQEDPAPKRRPGRPPKYPRPDEGQPHA